MFRFSRVFGTVAVLCCASVALAQRPPGGGFGFPFGGPGAAPSQLRLIADESVQKELGLKDDQVAKIKTLGEDARKEMQSVFGGGGGFGDFRNLSEEEREKRRKETQTKMEAATKKVNETILPKLNETLDATQRERLQQIRLQAWGSPALLDAEVAKLLDLSKEQSDKLAAINKDIEGKRNELFRSGDNNRDRGNFEERFAKMRELNEARDKQFTEVLTADQRGQLDKMKGKAFDVAGLRGGFGGRGGPGGAGGQPGGGRRRPPADEKKNEKKSEN